MSKTKTKQIGRVRAALASWLGIPIAPTDGDFWRQYYGVESAGVSVNPKNAMQLDAVWACVRLISETISTMPLSMYERTNSGRRIARDHRLHNVIHFQPNADTTAVMFWEAVVASMLLRGNAAAEKMFVGGRVVGLNFLDPARLSAAKRLNGTIRWTYLECDGTQRVIGNDRIWLIPGFSLDGKYGVSVIQYGAKVFGGAIAAENEANNTFTNGTLKNVYYQVDNWLNQEQRDGFHENLQGSVERGETPLLEGGTDVKSLGINPVDAQLLESRGFSVESICRWFRVPPHMVGHTEKTTSWGTGVEQQMIGFLTFTLMPWLRRIEQAISKDLLTPADRLRYYPKFNPEGLLRADSKARGEFYSQMVNNGIYTRDEVREKEDMEPRGGNADELIVQLNQTTLNQLGQNDEI